MSELQKTERRIREEILDGFLWKLMIAHQRVLSENEQLRAELALANGLPNSDPKKPD